MKYVRQYRNACAIGPIAFDLRRLRFAVYIWDLIWRIRVKSIDLIGILLLTCSQLNYAIWRFYSLSFLQLRVSRVRMGYISFLSSHGSREQFVSPSFPSLHTIMASCLSLIKRFTSSRKVIVEMDMALMRWKMLRMMKKRVDDVDREGAVWLWRA